MTNLFQALLSILTITVTQATNAATKANEGLGLLKQYIDLKIGALSSIVNDISGAISTAVEAAKTTLRGEITTAKDAAIDASNTYTDGKITQEVTDRNAAIATAKTGAENFATSLVQSEATDRGLAITALGASTTQAIAGVNDDLTAQKARISAIETSDAGSADDFLPYTIQSGTTSTVQSVLTAAAQALGVTTEGDRTYLLMFRGGGGSQTLTMPNLSAAEGDPATIDYVVNAGEKMRVKLTTAGQIQYVVHIEDPYAEQLAEVEYGVGQINLNLTLQNGALVQAVTSLSTTVSQLGAAVASLQGN